MRSTRWLMAAALAASLPGALAGHAAAWKHDVIGQYDQAVYLDERGNAISEQEFFRITQGGARNHVIETVEGSTKRITLRLLPRIDPVFTPGDGATARDIAAWKRQMIDPYPGAVYFDELGREIPEDTFFRLTVDERRSSAMQASEDRKRITMRLLPRGQTKFVPP